MLQKLMNNSPVSVRILILFFLICTLLIAKSIFLILFVTIFTIIVMVLSDRNVKLYVEALKKSLFWLLFLIIIYIIIFSDVLGSLYFIYKLILIIILLLNFASGVSLNMMSDGIYTIMYPLNKFVSDVDKKAYYIAYYISFLILLTSSGNKIKKLQFVRTKRKINIKYYLLPKIFYAVNQIKEIENGLDLCFYKVKKEKVGFAYKILVLCFSILFIVAIFKEVIL
ncbi:MAG: hypothetical protein IJY25_05410 [Bacilli bacterium]|nr:hypothetical protein [Bacilli bacterium]